MCGICGVVSNNRLAKGHLSVEPMLSSLMHRGPDGVGRFQEKNSNFLVDLHTRLSILDLGVSNQINDLCKSYDCI